MLFRKSRQSQITAVPRTELRQAKPSVAIETLEQEVCGSHWRSMHSINRITGMALGGLRASAIFTNESLNEQASALTSLTQKTVPLLIHVQDSATGNNQTLRLPFFRFFATNSQQSVDFTLIARKLSELSLLPIMVIHSGTESSYHGLSKEQVIQFLGASTDSIASPTPAQEHLFGNTRKRVPQLWNLDQPMTIGLSMPSDLRDRQWASRQKYFSQHIDSLLQSILNDFNAITGRAYSDALFLNPSAPHYIITTDPIPSSIDPKAPIVQVYFMTPKLHKVLRSKILSFIDHNHSRALATALDLSGYSLIHYGPLTASAIQAALALNTEHPVGIAGAELLFPSPMTPKEELYNQEMQDRYGLQASSPNTIAHGHSIESPLALKKHPTSSLPIADLHRFWARNGKYFATNQSSRCIATPALATGVLPAGSGKMLNTRTEHHAFRVVEVADLVHTLIARMNQDNYETSLLEQVSRPWIQHLQQRLQSGHHFLDVFNKACADLLQTYTGDQEQLKGALSNARHFIPTSCALVEPFASQQCIQIADDTPEHSAFFALLPNSSPRFLSNPRNILLDRDAFQSYVRTENNASQITAHLFSAVAQVEYRKKVEHFLNKVSTLLIELNRHISEKLSVSLSDELSTVLSQLTESDLTLAELAQKLDRTQAPVDKEWLALVHQIKTGLESLSLTLQNALQGTGRSSHGIVSQNAAGQYPWSPVVVPWAQNGTGGGVELTLGIWESHMASLIPEFILLRKADLIVQGKYKHRQHHSYYQSFSWKQLSSDELSYCPPLVLTGTDAEFYKRSGSLSEIFRTKAPIKVIVYDTLQSSPSAAFQHYLAHDIFVLQSSLSHQDHLIEGMAKAYSSPRPALMHILCPGTKDYLRFSEQAVKHGIYLLYQGPGYSDPDSIELHAESTLNHASASSHTLADMVLHDPRFAQEFRTLTVTGGTPVPEYLQLDFDDRQETIPIVMTTSESGHNQSWRVSEHLIDLIEEQDRFKTLFSRFTQKQDLNQIKNQYTQEIRVDIVRAVTDSLVELSRN